jgi:rhodanese-related sulfurtransferase
MSEKQIENLMENKGGCIVKELCPSEAWDLICRHQSRRKTGEFSADARSLVILDVRTPHEFSMNHLKGSINLDFRSPSFSELVSDLDKKKAYLVYCRTGIRANQAVLLMSDLGFGELYSLAGGISRWQCDGFEIFKENEEKG